MASLIGSAVTLLPPIGSYPWRVAPLPPPVSFLVVVQLLLMPSQLWINFQKKATFKQELTSFAVPLKNQFVKSRPMQDMKVQLSLINFVQKKLVQDLMQRQVNG